MAARRYHHYARFKRFKAAGALHECVLSMYTRMQVIVKHMKKKTQPCVNPLLGDCPTKYKDNATYFIDEHNKLLFIDLPEQEAAACVASLQQKECRISTVQAAILNGSLSPLLLPIAFQQRLPNNKHVTTTVLPMQKRLVLFTQGKSSGDMIKAVMQATQLVKTVTAELANTLTDKFALWVGLRRFCHRKLAIVQTCAVTCPGMTACAMAADVVIDFIHGGYKARHKCIKNAKLVCLLHCEHADHRLNTLCEQVATIPTDRRPVLVMFGTTHVNMVKKRAGCLPWSIFAQIVQQAPQECVYNAEHKDMSFFRPMALQCWLTHQPQTPPSVFLCSQSSITTDFVHSTVVSAQHCRPFCSLCVCILMCSEDASDAFARRYSRTFSDTSVWNVAKEAVQKRNKRKPELLCIQETACVGVPPRVYDTVILVCDEQILQQQYDAAMARASNALWVVSPCSNLEMLCST